MAKAIMEYALEYYESNDPRGEYVLVLEGKSHQKKTEEKQALALEIPIEEYSQRLGITPAQALTSITKRVARFYKTLY